MKILGKVFIVLTIMALVAVPLTSCAGLPELSEEQKEEIEDEVKQYLLATEELRGPEGLMGLDGPAGPMGLDGPQGPAGLDGSDGSDGPMGLPGPDGPRGSAGPRGPAGPQGLEGLPGLDGSDGSDGPMGPMGLQGDPGLQGEQGPAGPQGLEGLPGLDGSDGSEGPMGPMGLQGDPGLQGEQGPPGPEGPMGPEGLEGLEGPEGPQGPMGPVAQVVVCLSVPPYQAVCWALVPDDLVIVGAAFPPTATVDITIGGLPWISAVLTSADGSFFTPASLSSIDGTTLTMLLAMPQPVSVRALIGGQLWAAWPLYMAGP